MKLCRVLLLVGSIIAAVCADKVPAVYTPLDSLSLNSGGYGGSSNINSNKKPLSGVSGGYVTIGGQSISSAEASAGVTGGSYGGQNSFDSSGSSGKHYIGGNVQQQQHQQGGYGTVDFGGAAEGTGGYPSVYPTSNPGQNNPNVAESQANGGPAYTYYYQHYPAGAGASQQKGGVVQGAPSALGDDFSLGDDNDFGGIGGGLGGLAGIAGVKGLKGLGIIAAVAKGILAIKPFLIIGLLFLIAVPVLLLFLPVPIITVTGGGGVVPGFRRSGRSTPSIITSYVTNITEKVLSAEECLERILCKIPPPPEQYRKKAKDMWEEYGTTLVKNTRVSRGLNAYFENSSAKNRNFKCNQKFKCSSKFL